MSVLKAWFLVTGSLLALGLMWAFAPILIPMFMVAGLLGLLVVGMVVLARWLEARRASAQPPAKDPEA